MKTSAHIRKLIAIGVFVAFAYVCCVLFHFKVAFLSFELKDAVMTVGAMFYGPLAGAAIVTTVCVIELITMGATGIYGFIMNMLASLTFVCIGSLLYRWRRNMTGAVVSMVVASLSTVGVMLMANLLITPHYIGGSTADVAAMIPTLLFPFNLTKTIFNSAVVFLLYKPVSHALKSSGFLQKSGTASGGSFQKKRSILVTVIALAIAIVAMLYFFLVLGGSFALTNLPS